MIEEIRARWEGRKLHCGCDPRDCLSAAAPRDIAFLLGELRRQEGLHVYERDQLTANRHRARLATVLRDIVLSVGATLTEALVAEAEDALEEAGYPVAYQTR